MKLIVGLGNPGKKYEHTRHNIGFSVLDACIESFGKTCETGKRSKKADLYESVEFRCGEKNEKILFVKPLTFMNRSGEAVREWVNKHKKDLSLSSDLLILHDELALPLGRIKLDKDRSSAGHNGVANIIDLLGTKNIIRMRIGIGPAEGTVGSIHNFVLDTFSKAESKELDVVHSRCVEALRIIIEQGFAAAQNTVNAKV